MSLYTKFNIDASSYTSLMSSIVAFQNVSVQFVMQHKYM